MTNMNKRVFSRHELVLLFFTFFFYGETLATVIIPSQWQKENVNKLDFDGGKLIFGSSLSGNVCIPPYYYNASENYSYRDVVQVNCLRGSSHDGTWVQAPRKQSTRRAGWYYDGPFLGAVMDTLWLPSTLTNVERGAFENGTADVVIIAAVTPPTSTNTRNIPIYNAKLIVPTGSLNAYKEHEAWGKFATIIEGAEKRMPAQLIIDNGNLYEVEEQHATFIKGSNIITDEIEYKDYKYPVTEMGMACIDPYRIEEVTINAHITDFNPKYHLSTNGSDNEYRVRLSQVNVSPDNPAYASIDGVIYTKNYKELLYWSRSYYESNSRRFHIITIPCERIAEGAIPRVSNDGGWPGTLILPRPLANYCSGNVECHIVVAGNDFPFIQGDSISALYSDEKQCFDLHRYTTQQANVIIPGTLTDYGVSYPVKTIGKYSLYLGGRIYDLTDKYSMFYNFKLGYVGDKNEKEIFPPLTNVQTAIIPENIEEIYYMFHGASELKSVQLPQTLRLIGSKTFEDCKNLKEINLPSQIDSIGPYAFSGCHALTSINLPQSLKVVSYSCFQTCKNLTSVNLPSQLEIISGGAFKYCVKLEKIVIPATTKYICPTAFENCYALNDIYCLGQTPPLVMYPSQDPDLIYDVPFTKLFGETRPTPSSCTLHVPAGSLQAYRSAWVWKEFENIVEDAESSAVQSLMKEQQPITHYTLYGIKNNGQRGLNIVRYSDGAVKKVILK